MNIFLELKKVFNVKINIIIFFTLSFFIFLFLRILPHMDLLWQFWVLEGISMWRFLEVFYQKTIESLFLSTFSSNVVAIVFPVLVSLNIVLFKEYYKKQKIFLQNKTFFASLSGMFFGLFGVGCFACSGLILAPLISFLGLSFIFEILPYRGQELGYIGLLFILISIMYILKKLSIQNICGNKKV